MILCFTFSVYPVYLALLARHRAQIVSLGIYQRSKQARVRHVLQANMQQRYQQQLLVH